MRILYLDTSSSFLYCALVDNNKCIFEIKELLGKKMSEETLFKINYFFNKNNISTDSVEKIILVNGPGSFTGVRIGITIAKVYAYMKNIPIITISSLYAMSVSCDFDRIHVPIIDARRGYVYAGIYDSDSNIIMEDQYISLTDLSKYVNKIAENFVYISNDDFEFDVINYNPNFLKIVEKCEHFNSTEIHKVNANYLKATEAEEKNAN